jgi:alpha-1,6-mannosyltransferase
VIERLRWTGLAGTTLLAVSGYLAGARTGPAPATRAEALWGTDGWFRLGLLAYLAGLGLLGWAWWRLGRQWRPEPDSPGSRWVLVTGALWTVPLLAAPPLGSRDVYAYACQGAVWLDGHDPYSVGAAGGGCPWLETVPSLWHDTPAPYGPLGLLVSAAAVGLARLVASGESGQLLVAIGGLRAAAVLGALLVAGFLPRLARACGVPPAPASWLGLVTPLVAVHLVSGAHHDALVTGLVVAGLAMSARPRPAEQRRELPPADRPPRQGSGPGLGAGPALTLAAGVALALAVAVKVTAVAALPFALLLVGRRAGAGQAARDGGLLLLAAAGTFAGLTLVTGLGVGWVGALLDTGAIGQWSSLPTGLGMAVGYLLWGFGLPEAFDAAVNVARWLGLGVLAAVSATLLVRAWRSTSGARPVVAACGVVLAAVVVLGPVVYPWYAAVALAVLAASTQDQRVRRWLAVATVAFTALTLPSGLGVPVLTRLPGALLMALLVGLAGYRWWRRGVRRPGRRASVR